MCLLSRILYAFSAFRMFDHVLFILWIISAHLLAYSLMYISKYSFKIVSDCVSSVFFSSCLSKLSPHFYFHSQLHDLLQKRVVSKILNSMKAKKKSLYIILTSDLMITRRMNGCRKKKEQIYCEKAHYSLDKHMKRKVRMIQSNKNFLKDIE